MKKFLYISTWVVLFIGIFTLLGFIAREKNTMPCKGLEVNIDRSDNNYFILEEEIKDLFFNMGYGVDSQLISKVDTRKIERLVYNNPSAMKADVYATVDGKVKIDITQRKPVLRVFNENGESFYIDDVGWLMPLSAKFTSRVLVASGFIDDTFSGRYKNNLLNEKKVLSISAVRHGGKRESAKEGGADVLRDLFLLTKYINESDFWNAQITQLFVNSDKEIELIPRVGNHTILFGDITDMEEKFEKLMVFYEKGLKKVGWNTYSQIILKFKNQVVCKKK